MIKVGILGEDPNDTASLILLLTKKYKNVIQFCVLVKRLKGSHLDTEKFRKIVALEFKESKCSFVICIRDLDAFPTQTDKMNSRLMWFKRINQAISGVGILLLNIWELEALIIADITTFNAIYKSSFLFTGDVKRIQNPKEKLMDITSHLKKKYRESDCPHIFNKLDFEVVKNNCDYFRDFVMNFDKIIMEINS